MSFKRKLLGAAVAVAAVGGSVAAHADQLVNVQFDTDPAYSYSGAAVLGSAGDVWNQIGASTGTFTLENAQGGDSGVTNSVNAGGMYSFTEYAKPTGDVNPFTGTAYALLFEQYVFGIYGLT